MKTTAGLRAILLATMATAPPAIADFGDYLGHDVVGRSLTVRSTLGELRVTAVNAAAFEVHYVEDGITQLPSFALDNAAPEIATALTENEQSLVFAIEGLTAAIGKSPVTIHYSRNGNSLLSEEHGYFAYDTIRGFRFRLDEGEKILGGGMRVLGMDRRGERMPLYNRAHYEYETHSSQMYYSLPAVMSSDKYALIFDNSASGWLDIGHREPDVLQFDAVGGRTAYIVIAGDNFPELVGRLTAVTGRQPLPPRWAFGNFASRYGYRSERQVRDVVRRFREQDVPLDTVILDLFWFGPDTVGHMGNLDWDRQAWPTAEDMIADLAADGIGVVPVTEPFILTSSKTWQDAVASGALARGPGGEPRRFDFFFGNTGLIDIFDESAQDWFWRFYARLFDQGIAGSWGDLGEPEVHPADVLHRLGGTGIEATADEVHNAYGHVWTQMLYEKQLRRYPEKRPFTLMRSGFVGTQRYGVMPWTGDVARTWGGLKPQVELGLQMSLFGLAYTHSDLGGFAEAKSFDDELYIRWLQYGVFQPVFRPHAPDYLPPEPVFRDQPTRDIVREFIWLRYRLLPYLYTLAWENSMTGMPLMRPLFFEDESDLGLIDEDRAYLWGDAFLVAPVTDPGVTSVDVRLPAGAWFDFWTDARHAGGKTVSVPVTLETIPVLVRAGSFVPMTDVVPTTRQYSSERLTLHYYADESVSESSGRMYEDDGASRTSLEDGRFELLQFTARQDEGSLAIALERHGNDYPGMPEYREVTIVIHNWTRDVACLRFGDTPLQLGRRPPARAGSAHYDRDSRRIQVKVSWEHGPAVLQIN